MPNTLHSFLSSFQLCSLSFEQIGKRFECPVSRLLYDEGEVEYWMYEPVDFTEQSATRGPTGSVMQGALLFLCI